MKGFVLENWCSAILAGNIQGIFHGVVVAQPSAAGKDAEERVVGYFDSSFLMRQIHAKRKRHLTGVRCWLRENASRERHEVGGKDS
jgi:hypothetical protein